MKVHYLLFLTCLAFSVSAEEPQTKIGGKFGETRIESDYTLILPKNVTAEQIWNYLNDRYGKDSPNYILKDQTLLATRFSDESFRDTYFDNDKWDVLLSNSGIRHRQRSVDSNPDDRKNGRELVQVKLRPQGENALYRDEIKFPVKHYEIKNEPLDLDPLYGLVKRDKRQELKDEIAKAKYADNGWQRILSLDQRRRRVYISNGGKSYMTITVDEVVSKCLWKKAGFNSMEIELGEIAYSSASSEQRKQMEILRKTLLDDLKKNFPDLTEDVTPKYVRLYRMYEKDIPLFKHLVRVF